MWNTTTSTNQYVVLMMRVVSSNFFFKVSALSPFPASVIWGGNSEKKIGSKIK